MKLVVILALSSAIWLHPAAAQSINQREASATAKIEGSRGRYDGTFTGTGIASVCGEIPQESSITGVATFVVEYPSDDPGAVPIQSISFGSIELVGGKTSATAKVHGSNDMGETIDLVLTCK